MRAEVSFVLKQCTRLTDRRRDGWTERPSLYLALHYMPSHDNAYEYVYLCVFMPTSFWLRILPSPLHHSHVLLATRISGRT